jgi:hypothetical protein
VNIGNGKNLRAVAGRGKRSVLTSLQALDPSRFALPPRTTATGSIALVAVYRSRHAERLRRLLETLHNSAVVRLWCLDEPPDSLGRVTEGHGPGTRFSLLNRLIDTIPLSERLNGLVVSDDDYSFRVGSLPQLVAAGRALSLDMWQPAHCASSWVSYPFVRRCTGTVLRRTTFVEQGPLLVLSARAQRALLPLPEDLGMGWGAEIRWADAIAASGLRLAIIDALAIEHLMAGEGYDRNEQRVQLGLILDEAGIPSVEHLQHEHSRVGVWKGRRMLRVR